MISRGKYLSGQHICGLCAGFQPDSIKGSGVQAYAPNYRGTKTEKWNFILCEPTLNQVTVKCPCCKNLHAVQSLQKQCVTGYLDSHGSCIQ